MEYKICKKCGIEKQEKFFRNEFSYLRNKFYRRSICLDCQKLHDREFRKQYRKDRYQRIKEHHNSLVANWRLRNPIKRKCHIDYMNALRNGKIKKKECEYLNGKCEGVVGAHHWDYTKPLDVVFFCRKHHNLADDIRREKEKFILKVNS